MQTPDANFRSLAGEYASTSEPIITEKPGMALGVKREQRRGEGGGGNKHN